MKAMAFSLGTATPLMTIERPEGEVPASLVPLHAPLLGRPQRSDVPHVAAEVQSGSGAQDAPPVLATPLEAPPVLATPEALPAPLEALPVRATPLVAMPLEPVAVPALAAVPLFAFPLDAPAPPLVTDPALEAPVPPALAPLPPSFTTTTTATVPDEGAPPPDDWTPQERAALATRRPTRRDVERARCPVTCLPCRRFSTSQSRWLCMFLQLCEQWPGGLTLVQRYHGLEARALPTAPQKGETVTPSPTTHGCSWKNELFVPAPGAAVTVSNPKGNDAPRRTATSAVDHSIDALAAKRAWGRV